MDSPASAAKISKADTPPQEYSDAETDKIVSDRDEEGDNASDGAAADTEQAVSAPVQSTDTVGAHSEDLGAEAVDNNSVPPARSEDSHPEDTVAAEADVEQTLLPLGAVATGRDFRRACSPPCRAVEAR